MMSASAPTSATTSPTAVGYQRTPQICRVTVHQARHLMHKGRNGTNDAYVIMAMGKEKFQTSVVERTTHPQWDEQCDLHVGNTESSVELQVFHKTKLLDEFLGYAAIPISDIEFHGIPIRRWHKLHNKPGRKDAKERGEIEVTVSLAVDVSEKKKKKRTTSFREVASVVGSKFQLPHREKQAPPEKVTQDSVEESLPLTKDTMQNDKVQEIKADTNTLDSVHSHGQDIPHRKSSFKRRMKTAIGLKKKHSKEEVALEDKTSKLGTSNGSISPSSEYELHWARDWNRSVPNVRDSRDAPLLGHKRSRTQSVSDIASNTLPTGIGFSRCALRTISEDKLCQANGDTGKDGSRDILSRDIMAEETLSNVSRDDKLRHSFNSGLPGLRMEYVQVNFETHPKANKASHKLTIPKRYAKMSKEELIREVLVSDTNLNEEKKYIKELEDYIDDLLLKVMIETPKILDVNYRPHQPGTSFTL
ncbi:rab11 family-interacting protein 2-like [Ptychodera flava]|uniref:rab11 family-interacting protein 2-like n=1 Tax=Ptychodera flava TaxID=63121 RepID=UPI00396A1A9E